MRRIIAGAVAAFATMAPLAASASKSGHEHGQSKKPPPTCIQLGTDSTYGLAGNPQVTALTTTVVPVGTGVTVPYCRVDFTFSGEEGPSDGYRPGQKEEIRIRVGLPLSVADGGTGGARGAWNGKNRDLGGGGYAGSVGGVTSSTNLGYVGTSTDTGHNAAVQPGGSFALNPDNSLNWGQIRDFSRDGIRQQHLWGVALARTYYGLKPTRKYWFGCSTGGRQGHYQAQNFPEAYDGILAGAPAFNWDRFIPSELWPAIVMNQEVGAPISSAKLTAVSNAAIAACDAIDGITDGIVEDPRKCKYDAKSFVCTGGPSDPANCLTAAEAAAVNKIWDGPVKKHYHGSWHNVGWEHGGSHHRNGRAWYGLERGTPLFGLAGTNPFSIAVDHFKYWLKRDPNFDWHAVTEDSFFDDFLLSVKRFNKVIGTDDDLREFRKADGKMITYHGLFDPLIFPRGTYNYYNEGVDGSVKDKDKFYRFFPYPNAGHCGGAGLNAEALFSALVNWVENRVEPDFLVAQVSPTRTRKICKYPDVQVYSGSGSTDDHNNFTCQARNKDDKDLLDQDEIAREFEPRRIVD